MTDVKVEVEHRELPPDWERWRGSVDTSLSTMSSQLRGMNDGLVSQLSRMERGLNQRLAQMDTKLQSVDTQTKLTNGRVNGHDVELAELHTEERTRERTETQEVESRRYSRTTLLSWIGATAALVGASGGLLGALHVI